MATNNTSNNTDQLAANSIRGNNTGSPALGLDLTVAQTKTLLDITTGQIGGTATNDNAAAGKVGEFISSVIASGSAVTINDVTATDLTSISLTAGDWDVCGNVNVSGTTMTNIIMWSSTTSATLPDSSLYNVAGPNVGSFNNYAANIPTIRYSLSGTTTIYISAYQDGIGSGVMSGGIYARRVR